MGYAKHNMWVWNTWTMQMIEQIPECERNRGRNEGRVKIEMDQSIHPFKVQLPYF